ncbi:MAG TPA: phytanoyl-CoA dioxygenase family protein [Jatrophihabitans sp.]|nr:phytanoyl-CoA dioxygenase family protein [Jatrophihabitans sp.]
MVGEAGCAGRRLPGVLSSNGVEIPVDGLFTDMRDSTRLAGEPDRLRDRFAEDGYVLLRGLLDRRQVLELRADYFARFDPGYLAPGSPPEAGVFSGTAPAALPEYGTAGHPAYDMVRSTKFDTFTRDHRLLATAESLLGGAAELLPRRILRHFHRGSGKASRAHIDYDYMDQGSDQLVTAWIPLGDCPIECGGLIYLEGSQRAPAGKLERLREHTDRPDDRRPISNDLSRTARELGGRWLWTDYRAGDVILHSPYLVHASLDNLSDTMRLSADLRFRRRTAELDRRWTADWSADDGF